MYLTHMTKGILAICIKYEKLQGYFPGSLSTTHGVTLSHPVSVAYSLFLGIVNNCNFFYRKLLIENAQFVQ